MCHDEADDIPPTLLQAAPPALGFPGTTLRPPHTAVEPQSPPGEGAEPFFPRIPGYEVLGELGRGGMGAVYKARRRDGSGLFAVKVILTGGYAGPEAVARFRTEAEAISRLRHPNIVPLHEFGHAEGYPFLAMPLLEGGCLADRLGAPWPAGEAARAAELLARAAGFAHGRRIVHRDLKPQNILLAADGRMVISDWGLAKLLDGRVGPTWTGQFLGTPCYMAPEQAECSPRGIGPPADVYALGVILYEMLTGRPPFRGKSALDTLDRVRRESPAPPSRLQGGVPGILDTICLQCLEKDPAGRPPDASALAGDLHTFLADAGTREVTTTLL